MDEPLSFGAWVRRRRRALDLTSEDLAGQVGCAGVTIRKIELDERRPSRQIAERLAVCLEVPEADRPTFLKAARAELAIDRLATPAPPMAPISPPAPRQRAEHAPRPLALKGYELHEQIGAGGFGVVYRAVQPGIDREVAVKIILPEYANHPEFIRRFEAEAQLVVRLEHPHIVPLYDYWRESGRAYLVMRYLRGGSLQAVLSRGAWDLERCTRLAEQVGGALALAHRHGAVHRDIKPANILLDEEGNAYLADFGIAKELQASGALGETQPAAIIGSPAYLSPEQIRDEPITPQTDIYGLGLLLYEALAGAHPFATFTPAEQLAKQLSERLPPLRPDLPPALNEIVQRATAKNPSDRYPDIPSLVGAWQRAATANNRGVENARTSSTEHDSPGTLTEPDLAAIENPYKGLRAFAEADAADFFGRAALTQRLLERMAEPEARKWGPGVVDGVETIGPGSNPQVTRSLSRFLAVVGPSGSGKSSVVRAGLLPALRRGGLPGSERWFVVELLPGAHPFEELEAALLRIAVNPPESLIGQLREDERGLARAVKRALPADPEAELGLVIDQFEELFTLTESEVERQLFLAALRAAVDDPHSRLRVIITLRADFYDRPLGYTGFGELMREHTEVVLPLTSQELEHAIADPAARAGLAPAPELVAAIVQDVGEQPGTLPLLQYALTELFERREGLALTLAAYRASGGVRGALARRAEAIYAALDAAGQAAARQLFLRLVTLGEGVEDTRRRVLRSELTMLTDDGRQTTNGANMVDRLSAVLRPPSVMEVVIDTYGHARLLSFDRDPIARGATVEVAHEALLREWGRLRAWLDTSRADVRMQRMLAVGTAEWQAGAQDPSYLLGGARLAQFAGWAEQTDVALTHAERAFLEASSAEEAQRLAAERERQQRELEIARQLAAAEQRRADEQTRAATRLRRSTIYLAGALLLALVAAVAAGMFARTAQINAARSESLRLASEANALLDRGENGDLAALLALRSLRTAASPQATSALERAISLPFAVQRFVGHTNVIYGVAFSPDGKYVLTGSADKTARLWDATTGQQVRIFTGHTGAIYGVAFSPDGRLALTGSADKTARLWDATTGQQVRQFKGHTDQVTSVSFSPDGKHILTGSRDTTARLWDAATGKQLGLILALSEVWTVSFSPDGNQLATAQESGSARLWNAVTGKILESFFGHAAGVNGVAFSPDGKQVATASSDRTIRLWDTQTGRQLRVFSGHTDAVLSVVFSPDGAYLLTSSLDKTARLWDVATGQLLHVFAGHAEAIREAVFSPNGKYVLIGSSDQAADLWDVLPMTEPLIFAGHTDEVHTVAFSPDSKQIVTAGQDRTARLWDAQTGQLLHILRGHTDNIWSVAFSPDGKYVVTGGDSDDPTVRLWDTATGHQVRVFQHGDWVSGMIFSPDGRRMFTGSGDGNVRLWDVQTGNIIRQFRTPAGVSAIAVSPDGKYVLTGSDDKIARLWDSATGQQLRTFTGHTAMIWSVAFSPDGKYALTGSDSADSTARLWEVATGKQVRLFGGHSSGIRRVAFSPDGRLALTGSFDGTARLWDVTTGQPLRVFSDHTAALFGVAFSSDGKEILTGSGDKTARLWHLDQQTLIPRACARLQRDLTADERATYSITDDAPTCPQP